MPKKEFAQLAHVYAGSNVVGHKMSRKLNGGGCVWDGGITRGMPAEEVPWYYKGGDDRLHIQPKATGLWSIGRADKYGPRPKVLNAPNWFLDKLPVGIPLQGELWCNDNLSYVKSVCGRGESGKHDVRWNDIRFVVYNSKPYNLFTGYDKVKEIFNAHIYRNDPANLSLFEKNKVWSVRMELARNLIEGYYPSFADVGTFLDQLPITTMGDLEAYSKVAVHHGWEGIMVVNPNSYYETSRSYNLLKVKPQFDAEAVIVDHDNGKTGKNLGRLGCLKCMLTWDEKVTEFTGGKKEYVGKQVIFGVSGMKDSQREWDYVNVHYSIGTVISFTFLGVTEHGIPFSCNIKE